MPSEHDQEMSAVRKMPIDARVDRLEDVEDAQWRAIWRRDEDRRRQREVMMYCGVAFVYGTLVGIALRARMEM